MKMVIVSRWLLWTSITQTTNCIFQMPPSSRQILPGLAGAADTTGQFSEFVLAYHSRDPEACQEYLHPKMIVALSVSTITTMGTIQVNRKVALQRA